MDFPGAVSLKPTIGVASRYGFGVPLRAAGQAISPANAAWPSNNLGVYAPLRLPALILVKSLWWLNGVPSGNVDVGIYTAGGTRLASSTPIAGSGSNVPQSVALGTPLLLVPGVYYMALSCSTTAATFRAFAVTAINVVALGLAQQAAVGTLPATATFATFAQTVLPIMGISRSTAI